MSFHRDFRTILGFDPDYERQCVGISKSYLNRPTCTNIISKDDRQEAGYILDKIDRSTSSFPSSSDIQELAGLMLCKSFHNSRSKPHLNQISEVSLKWNMIIQKEFDMEVKRKERKERKEQEARERSTQELARFPVPKIVEKPTTKAVVRKPAFEVFLDEPTIASSNFATNSKENVVLAKSQCGREQVARSYVKPSSAIIQGSIFPTTPNATPSPRRDVSSAENKTELPSTPTKPAKSTKEELKVAVINNPLPLTPESLFSFGDRSSQTTPGVDFGFTPPPALGQNQPLTPPSSVKSERIFGPLLASQQQSRLLKPDSTPTPQRSGRLPLGPKSASNHNTRSIKEPDSSIGIIKKDNKLPSEFLEPVPLKPFTHVSVAEIHESGDFALESLTQKQIKVGTDEVSKMGVFEDSPTIPSELPTPSRTTQTWYSSKQDHQTTQENLHEKSLTGTDPTEENPASQADPDDKSVPYDESVSDEEDKKKLEPATDVTPSLLSAKETVHHEPDFNAVPPITPNTTEEGFGHVTIISTTTTSYRTYIPKQKSAWDSSLNRISVADLQNRGVTYDSVSAIARKPLLATPAPVPVPIVQTKLKERLQLCEACGGVEMGDANICYCVDGIELNEVPIRSGCLSGLRLRRLKDKVVKKLKKRAERQ